MPGRSAGARTFAAGASARARYRILWVEHRRERFIMQAVVAGAAAVGASALLDVLAGLVAGVTTALLYAVYVRIRPSPTTRWRRGAAAERRTGRLLSRLGVPDYHVLHDLALLAGRGRAVNLDHLVIGLTGVYAIATRRWSRGGQVEVERRGVFVGGRPIGWLLRATARSAVTVSELLGAELDFEVPVSGVLAVHGAQVPRGGVTHEDAMVQRADRLPSFVRDQPVVFTSAQVEMIAAVAERRLPPMTDRMENPQP